MDVDADLKISLLSHCVSFSFPGERINPDLIPALKNKAQNIKELLAAGLKTVFRVNLAF